MGQIKKNDVREACNMQGTLSTAYEVNSDNLQRRNQLADLPLDDTKDKNLQLPHHRVFSIVLFDKSQFI